MPDTQNIKITTRAEYDALQALNYSGAKELLKSPAHFKAYAAAEREETKALRMGTITHALVLEPEAALARYAIAPEVDKRTKAGKELFEIFTAANAGKTIVAADEWAVCEGVGASMRARLADLGFRMVATELMLAVDYCGVPLKSAIDAVVEDKAGDRWIVDLKTTEDASPKGFLSSVRAYRYNLQAHFYRTVYETYSRERIKGFVFVAAEKSAPYLSAAYRLGPELISYAVADFEQAVNTYKGCVAFDEWPGYPAEVVDLDIPAKSAATPITFA